MNLVEYWSVAFDIDGFSLYIMSVLSTSIFLYYEGRLECIFKCFAIEVVSVVYVHICVCIYVINFSHQMLYLFNRNKSIETSIKPRRTALLELVCICNKVNFANVFIII